MVQLGGDDKFNFRVICVGICSPVFSILTFAFLIASGEASARRASGLSKLFKTQPFP